MYIALGACPAPVDHQQIVSAMNDWNNDKSNNCGSRITVAYVLEHQYPKSNTSFRLLKRADKLYENLLLLTIIIIFNNYEKECSSGSSSSNGIASSNS